MELPGWDWPAVAALATVGIAAITAGVGIAACYFIHEGIRAMNKSSDERASERRQAQAAHEAEQRRAREELAEWREADERRHKEAMDDSRRRDEEGRRRHEEAMAALAALIERTGGPRSAPAE